MRRLLILMAACSTLVAGAATPDAQPTVYETSVVSTLESQIDKLVYAQLPAGSAQPALCSDAVFVRRAYLDVIGTLPTAQQAKDFILNPDTENKRRALIEKLLAQDEFAEYWAMKWGDILRIKAEFPVNLWPNAAQAYHRWVRASIAQNKRYDEFVREMLTSSGSNFRVGQVNFYRAIQNRTPEGIAGAVSLTFMGVRAETWSSDQLTGMSAFFSQIGYKPSREWKEEIVFWDPLKSAQSTNSVVLAQTNTEPKTAIFPDGTKLDLPPNRDPREIFADWLITPKNPWFTRNIANRVWSWLLGKGIIQEPDDIRSDNLPSNPELLAYLEKELIVHQYNLKHLYRLILNSRTYQACSVSRSDLPDAEALFACYPVRRLDAEVLIDAINKVTGSSDLYTSAIPEPFTYIPTDKPAIALADGSITSPFLALFGRSARATGMESERNNKMMPSQWLHLLNSSHIQRKIEQGPNLKKLIESSRTPHDTITDLYLAILSRYPTPAELKNAEEYGNRIGKTKIVKKRREDWIDLAWALVNSTEFVYRH